MIKFFVQYLINQKNLIFMVYSITFKIGFGKMVFCMKSYYSNFVSKRIEYILEWNLANPSVWILSVPFSLKKSSNCTNHVNAHKLYAVAYTNTVCSLNYPFQFRIF